MATYICTDRKLKYKVHLPPTSTLELFTIYGHCTNWGLDDIVHLHVRYFHDRSLCHCSLDNLNIIILYSYTDKMYSHVWYVSHLSALSPFVCVFTVSAVQLGNLANGLDWLCAWVASLRLDHRWVLCAHLLAIWMSLQNWFTEIDGVV